MKTPIRQTILAVAAILAFAPAARAARISEINPVIIPSGLDTRDAKAAMVQALAQKTIDPKRDQPENAWVSIVDELLDSRVLFYESPFKSKTKRTLRPWFIESVEDDAVIFGCRVRRHYMSVRMQIAESKITPQVVVSENLDQKKDKIHDNAVKWITDLSTEIRAVLGKFSTIKAGLKRSADLQETTKKDEEG
jgi:hypothetical protein